MKKDKLNKYKIPYYWYKDKKKKEMDKDFIIVEANDTQEASDKAYDELDKKRKTIFIGKPRIIEEVK